MPEAAKRKNAGSSEKTNDEGEEISMQSNTCKLSAFTLSIVIVFGTAAMAADLPKEGTFSGSCSSVGTVKAILIGKERVLLTFDESGLTLDEGLFNHWTWHCWGLGDFSSGIGQDHGYCVGTDPAGEQVALNFGDEKHQLDQKIVTGSFTITTGTGKYAGITGSATYKLDGSEFRSPEGGPVFGHNTHQGNYKLP
jgi:hypothetical protein